MVVSTSIFLCFSRLYVLAQEYDMRRRALVGELFVAKHSKRSLTHEDSESALTGAKALDEAAKLAGAFNSEMDKCFQSFCAGVDKNVRDGDRCNIRVDRRLWRVQFLTCSIYRCLRFSSELTLGL